MFQPNASRVLDDRSPLSNGKPNPLCRMPTIFQQETAKDLRDAEATDDVDSIQKINQSIKSSQDNVIDDIQKLVNEGGSSAYLLYLA